MDPYAHLRCPYPREEMAALCGHVADAFRAAYPGASLESVQEMYNAVVVTYRGGPAAPKQAAVEALVAPLMAEYPLTRLKQRRRHATQRRRTARPAPAFVVPVAAMPADAAPRSQGSGLILRVGNWR